MNWILATDILKNKATKIALILLSGLILYSCSLVKRVPAGKHLLKDNNIIVNGEQKDDEEVRAQLYQQPNTNILGYHVRLHLYNLAKPDADSMYNAWLERNPKRHNTLTALLSEKQVQRLGNSFVVSGFSNFLKQVGEPPVLVDLNRIKKSRNRLTAYYHKQGYFRTKVSSTVDTLADRRAVVKYNVVTGQPYIVDSIATYIETPALDSLYQEIKKQSLIKKGEQYKEINFTAERERITSYFRNHGAYTFQQNNVSYVVDTVSTGYKANVDILVDNESIRRGDSVVVQPFKLYKISKVNIYTNNPNSADQSIDSVSYNGFNLYSKGKLNYRPKAITDAIFITPGSTFSDNRRIYTSRALTNLRVFNYPPIQFLVDSTDATGTSLIANITLNPRKKFRFNVTADFTHSNIQDFGIQGSMGLSIRNIFKGAEILEISTRGNIGSSRDLAIQDNRFFNISEYGADVKLNFPRIWFPVNTERIISKRMLPATVLSLGISRQRNIGLDKESFNGILTYNWTIRQNVTAKLDLFNIQYIRNVNSDNYFNVYNSSYNLLNQIANNYNPDPSYFDEQGNLIIEAGTRSFTSDVQSGVVAVSDADRQTVNSIEERRRRLTENNLISSTSFTYTRSTRENLQDNTFFIFKTKAEVAGNTLGLLAHAFSKDPLSESGNRTIFDVEYSQYAKGELDLIKHFDLHRGNVLAMRAFFGLAVPYGNSNTIPFTRSYFGGGSNDNRAWQSYSLGPGRSGGLNDFNEANLKMAYSAELRFNIFGKLNGAVFGDVGNIWNVFDNVKSKEYTFNGLESFKDLALGTGLGFRYDFNFFVVRFDVGFKTYNPGRPENDRWFKEYNIKHAVLNVGINYPF